MAWRSGRILGAAAALLVVSAMTGGCGSGGSQVGRGGGDSLDRLRQQAREALDRYAKAVTDAGGKQGFVPVGELTGQIGDWEADKGENKALLMTGLIVAMTALPEAPQPTGTVVWDGGATLTVPLISAGDALQHLIASAGTCGGCALQTPLEVTGARLTTARIDTTRGTATAPAWEYRLKGTAVRVTRVAVGSSATVTVIPPSWDPYHAPVGLSVESATLSAAAPQRLTVYLTGSPGPGDQPCGADYTAEAVESAHAVVVIIIEHPHNGGGDNCSTVGARRTATVDLAAPLGERAVLEVKQGMPVKVTLTGRPVDRVRGTQSRLGRRSR